MAQAPVRFEVDAKALRAEIRRIGDTELQKQLGRANKAAAELVVKAALPNVPVRTGRLKRSVRALGSQSSGRVKAGDSAVDYAAAVHWGRGKGNVNYKHGAHAHRQRGGPITGRPFIWDAMDKMRGQIVGLYGSAMKHVMQGIRSR